MTSGIPTPESVKQMREMALSAAGAAALRAAVKLGLPDAIDENTPADVAELAAALRTSPEALLRLLRALACRGVFAEEGPGRYAHTDLSRLLRSDASHGLAHMVLWATEPWTWEVWQHLDRAVRTGAAVFPKLHGKDFFSYLHEDAAESAKVFDRAMAQSSALTAAAIVDRLDLTGVSTLADIAGGRGTLLAALLEHHPGLQGVLFDLPAVVTDADPRLLDGGALADRARIVSGDCRAKMPVRAEMYVLKNVLEWDDESTVTTLRNIADAAPPGARVVIIENLVDQGPEGLFATGMDLLLLLNVGGRKHTEAGLRTLIEKAGLHIREVAPVGPRLHMFDCRLP